MLPSGLTGTCTVSTDPFLSSRKGTCRLYKIAGTCINKVVWINYMQDHSVNWFIWPLKHNLNRVCFQLKNQVSLSALCTYIFKTPWCMRSLQVVLARHDTSKTETKQGAQLYQVNTVECRHSFLLLILYRQKPS